MKRFILFFIVCIIMVGCNQDTTLEEDKVKEQTETEDNELEQTTNEADDEQEETPPDSFVKENITITQTNELDLEQVSGPVQVDFSELIIASYEVPDNQKDIFHGFDHATLAVIEMSITNTSNDVMYFFPNQSTITTNTGETMDADMLISSLIGIPLEAGKELDGNIIFILESDPEEIDDIKLTMPGTEDESNEQIGEPINLHMELR